MAVYTNFKVSVLDGVSAYNVTSPFGPRTYEINGKVISDFHNGIDLLPKAKVKAFQTGKVIAVLDGISDYQKTMVVDGKTVSVSGGNYIKIQHDGGYVTIYKHLAKYSITVKVGDIVPSGAIIATVGASGNVTGPHLHFEIQFNVKPVDPLPYLQGIKTIKPFEVVTALESRPESAMMLVLADGLNYRDSANGNRLGSLEKGKSYVYLGKTKVVSGYEWARIEVKDGLYAYCALNTAWNTIIPIQPVEIIKPFHTSVVQDGMLLVVDLSPVEK